MKKPLLTVLSVAVVVLSGCSSEQPTAAPEQKVETKAKVVDAYSIKPVTEPIWLSMTGIVEAKRSVELSFGASGKISAITIEKGMNVKQGQTLASLDTSYYQAAVAAAAGQVQQSAVLRKEARKGSSKEEINQQRLQIQSAQQSYDQAAADYSQSVALFEGGAISKSERDKAKLMVEQAQITLQNQKIALDRLLKGADASNIARADASYQQATSEVARTQQTLKDSKLIAPFSGTIVAVTQQVGQLTNPGQGVLQLVDLSEVKVSIDVTNDIITQYTEGKEVNVVGDGGLTSKGNITFVSPVIDKATGKYRVEVTIPNNKQWRGGMLAQVQIPRTINGVVVPLESVGMNESKRYVLVVEGGILQKREVQVGQVLHDQIEIVSGLKQGEKVVRSGITYFVDGEQVVAKGE